MKFWALRLWVNRALLKLSHRRHEDIGCGKRRGDAGIVVCWLHQVHPQARRESVSK